MCMHMRAHTLFEIFKKIKSKKKQVNYADKVPIHSYPPACPSLGYTTRETTAQPEIQTHKSSESGM